MAEFIDIRDLYTSIVRSVDEANRLLEEVAGKQEFSYAITELDFSASFQEIVIEDERVKILLTEEGNQASENRNVKFKVRSVPRTIVQKTVEEEEEVPGQIVPDVLNLLIGVATEKIKASGLEVGEIRYDPRGRPVGHVMSQSPAPLTRVVPETKVNLVVAGVAPEPAPRSKRTSRKKPSQ